PDSELQLGAGIDHPTIIIEILTPGQRFVIQTLLQHRGQFQFCFAEAESLGEAQVDSFETPLVEQVCAMIEQAGVPAMAPVAHPAGGAAMAWSQTTVEFMAGVKVDVCV